MRAGLIGHPLGHSISPAIFAAAFAAAGIDATYEPWDTEPDVLAARIARSGAARLRVTAPVSAALARACNDANVVIDDTPATGHGRVELPRWLHEQAISSTRHRHGRVPG